MNLTYEVNLGIKQINCCSDIPISEEGRWGTYNLYKLVVPFDKYHYIRRVWGNSSYEAYLYTNERHDDRVSITMNNVKLKAAKLSIFIEPVEVRHT
jgi:hypothetical protein